MKRVGRAAEFLAWTVFFALAALVLALRFWLLPDIERYREDIAAVATRAVGQPVRVARIEGEWSGLHPRVNLTDVRIHDGEGREVLALPKVEALLSWRAILRGELQLHSLVVDGLRLQVRRDAGGGLHVAGIHLSEGSSSGFTDWVLAQKEFILRSAEVEWRDEQRGAPPLVLSALNLRLLNSGATHAIGLTAQPAPQLGSTVELRGLLRGRSLSELAAWDGQLYAELGYTDLAAWRPWIEYPWEVSRGEGALRMWLSVERGELQQATADVALAQVSASLGEQLAPLRLASLRGRLQARFAEQGYEVRASGLTLDAGGHPSISPGDFLVRYKPGVGGAFAAESLELEPLAQLAASLPLPAEGRRLLAKIAPRGRLVGIHSDWTGPVEWPDRFTARGSFSELAAEPSGELPGFAGLSGRFETTADAGRVALDSRNSALHLPRVLPGEIVLDTLHGQVEWSRQERGGFSVRVRSLSFASDHFSGNAYGTYSHAGEGPGVADLSAQFNRADARHIAHYLPHAQFLGGRAVRDWLVTAIVGGQSSDVRVRLRGNLADFPFRNPLRGEFSVRAQIENGVLHYAEGWPRIERVSGELLFERDRMEITGRGGLLGVALTDVRVSLPRLGNKAAAVSISGQAEGPTAGFLDYVASSPVRRMAGGITDSMTALGRSRLHLKLQLPLENPPQARVAGDLDIQGNHIAVHPDLPVIERASGRIRFTESAITGLNLDGRLFGGALTLGGGTQRDGSLAVIAKGQATVEGARPFFDHPLGSHFSGAAPYVARINVANGRARFELESSLRGIESRLPAPLAKSPEEDFDVRIGVVPVEGGTSHYVSVILGRLARVAALRSRDDAGTAVQRATLALSPAAGARIRLPQQDGLLVYGSLAALDLDQWLPVLAMAAGTAGESAFNVKIGALDLYGKRVHDATLRGAASAAGWSGSVAARELAGDISWRGADGGRLVARLTHLRMPEDHPGAAPREPLAPKDLPTVELTAERFTYRGNELGRMALAAQRTGGDWRIDELTIANPDGAFKASGVWRTGTPSLSALEFDLQASDAGGLLNRLGYRDFVKGGRAQLAGSLSWIGGPTTIDYPSLAGQVKLQAHDGRFLEIEPGLGKLVSLMSLQSLPRRIALDFRDVFSKGFEFEHISSSGQLAGGVMALEDFRMQGSSAEVFMAGKVDLARETQDLRVRVIPSLGDSASTVIALVNPLLAIPAAIAQKILKDPLGQIFAFNYAVTGGWAEPLVEKLGIVPQPADPQ